MQPFVIYMIYFYLEKHTLTHPPSGQSISKAEMARIVLFAFIILQLLSFNQSYLPRISYPSHIISRVQWNRVQHTKKIVPLNSVSLVGSSVNMCKNGVDSIMKSIIGLIISVVKPSIAGGILAGGLHAITG